MICYFTYMANRLAIPYAAILFCFMAVGPHLGSGPFWHTIAEVSGIGIGDE